ncbi:hypothetical protein [Streptomyces sp. NPDC005244]|uniref:hypothetical protein n=1 Tax=Streptomyces sp. NPDC005244 TaxID=3364708 RepID=UPI003676C79F
MTARIGGVFWRGNFRGHGYMDGAALDAVEDVAARRLSFVRVRMFGPDHPVEAMDL